ncbi:MAG: EAL domain-containing protein [Acidobacteriota bacterium]
MTTPRTSSREELLAALVEQASDGLLAVDAEGHCQLANPAARRLLGADVLATPPHRWGEHGFVRLDGVDLVSADLPLAQALEGREPDELILRRIAGERHFDLRMRARPLLSEEGGVEGALLGVRDITDQRRKVEQLTREAQRYRTLTELVSDYAYELEVQPSGQLRPLWITDAFVTATGFTMDDVSQEGGLAALFHPADHHALAQHFAAVQRGEEHAAELRLQSRHAEVRWIQARARPVADPETGATTRILGAARDVTDERLLDPLTGLPNLPAFLDRVTVALRRLARHQELQLAVLHFGLERLHEVNESYGFLAGDHLLREVAGRLQSSLEPGDTVAHVRGDEFAVLLAEIEHPSEALKTASRLLDTLTRPWTLAGHRLDPRARLGVAFSSDSTAPAIEILRSAQTAGSRSGDLGARVAVYDPAMQAEAAARLDREADLRASVEREEFPVLLQPVVDLAGLEVVGFEALARWQHPREGLLGANDFIPVAEETGLIVQIGEQVLRQSCATLAKWRASHERAEHVSVAVNVSARQLADLDLVGKIEAALSDHQLPPDRLRLEITESSLMEDPDGAELTFQRLRQRGVKLSLDDFGTGHSSLSYVRRFPIDALKVDRSFVSELATEGADAGIVETILALARHLGLTVVAEGVETREQLTFLRRLGCDQGQGYYFAKPMPAKEALYFLSGEIEE